MVQEESSYEGSSDVRAQLRFFEQLDQLEKQRKEGQERQILLKAAKVTSPPTRPSQAGNTTTYPLWAFKLHKSMHTFYKIRGVI